MRFLALPLLFLPFAALAQIRGAVNPAPTPTKPQPIRNDVGQAGEEIVTLRTFHIKKGTFDQFLKASQDDVWPYFEKIGSRIIGMWLVFDPNNSGPAKDLRRGQPNDPLCERRTLACDPRCHAA